MVDTAAKANNGVGAAAAAAPPGSDEENVDQEDSESKKAAGGAGNGASASIGGSVSDKERKIGHRRVNEEGQVSYKKVSTNQLMGSIQLGIGHAIGALNKYDDRDLLMQDFMTVETTHFPKSGSNQTPAHSFSEYTFRTYAPLAFRYFLNLFGIQREDFLVSLCSRAMRELSNPGASGSIFYLTCDDEFILKTVQHKEAEFLQKLLPGYYMNLNQNPHTLLPKFFGMFTYQCNQKNIRVTIMNNLLPSNIRMHLKFDLKGSTFQRKASKHERAKKSPTFKDLDFMGLLPEGLLLEAETYNALITTMRRDCRVLESFRIMDYSLLIGVHNLDQAAKEEAENSGGVSPTKEQARRDAERKLQKYANKQKLVTHSTPMESIQAQTEPIDEQDHLPPGGIPARNHKGERLLLYLGIIDILQSYRMRKKLEHTFKAIIHDGDTVSVHRPSFYAHRFLDFMADKVFKKIPSPLKHSPSKKGKRESIKKLSTTDKEESCTSQANNGSQQRPDVVPGTSETDATEALNPPLSDAVKHGGGKPRHRQHESVLKQSGEIVSVSDVRAASASPQSSYVVDSGTPSRISVGGTSWATPTWTEGTPSYTDSTMSESLDHGITTNATTGLGNNPSRSVEATLPYGSTSSSYYSSSVYSSSLSRSGRKEVQEKRLETCSYQETEM